MFQPLNWYPTSGQLNLLAGLGAEDFIEQLLQWLHQELGADQCMIFYCADTQQVSTLLFKDFSQDASGKKLAQSYVAERRYLQDPNFAKLKNAQPGDFELIRLQDSVTYMGFNYRERYFDEPGFQDKLAIVYATEQGNFYINLYRRESNFDAVIAPAQQAGLGRLLGILVSKHYQINQAQLSQGPLAFLSERERQVCNGVLQGKKSEVIAYELQVAPSSVVTYRKRAYEKLGINSRAQLFALCQN